MFKDNKWMTELPKTSLPYMTVAPDLDNACFLLKATDTKKSNSPLILADVVAEIGGRGGVVVTWPIYQQQRSSITLESAFADLADDD
ncbi:hypothetical protein QYF36_023126 [Acer negundo]|nr:hypothetical protein QYF36_023126 [Acer negundo]